MDYNLLDEKNTWKRKLVNTRDKNDIVLITGVNRLDYNYLSYLLLLLIIPLYRNREFIGHYLDQFIKKNRTDNLDNEYQEYIDSLDTYSSQEEILPVEKQLAHN